MKKKRFIVRKYIMGTSALEVIKSEKTHPVDDVWVDEEWMKNNFESEKKIGL